MKSCKCGGYGLFERLLLLCDCVGNLFFSAPIATRFQEKYFSDSICGSTPHPALGDLNKLTAACKALSVEVRQASGVCVCVCVCARAHAHAYMCV